MPQLSILEVFDPFINQFIKVDEAISRGIFNDITYQYNDYVNNKTYSITDAAKRGFFRTEATNDPETMVVEKLRVTQTFEIVTVSDPFNKNMKLSVEDAVNRGFIDLQENIYHDLKRKRDYTLSDAIEEKLITVKLMNESHEKIKETLVEKTESTLANAEKIETITLIEEDKPFVTATDDYNTIQAKKGNKVYASRMSLIDKTEKIVEKPNRKRLPTALVRDLATNRLLEIDEAVRKGIFNESTALYYDKFDLNKAIETGNIILPDSDYLVKNIKSVKDIKDEKELSIGVACKRGIIDIRSKLFLNTQTNKQITLFEALHKGFITLRTDEDDNEEVEVTVNDIRSVYDPSTARNIKIDEAIDIGLVNKFLNLYIEPKTQRAMKLNEAVNKGLAFLNEDNEDDQVMTIIGVRDPLNKNNIIELKEAFDRNIIDYAEATFKIPHLNQTIPMSEAFDRGYLITESNKNALNSSRKSSISDISEIKPKIDETPRLRKKEETKYKSIEQVNEEIEQTRVKSAPQKYTPPTQSEQQKNKPKQRASSFQQTSSEVDTIQQVQQKPVQNSIEVNAYEKVSSRKKKSLFQKLRQKLSTGSRPQKLTRSGFLDSNTISQSLIFVDTKSKKEYNLIKAVKKSLITNPNQISDTKHDHILTLCESLSRSIIYFSVSEELKLSKIDNSFYDSQNLYIIYYINDPRTRRPMSLVAAIRKGYLNKFNTTFTDKKKIISLDEAIERGFVAGAIIRLRLLADVIKMVVQQEADDKMQDQNDKSSRRQSKDSTRNSMKSEAFNNNNTELDSGDEDFDIEKNDVGNKLVSYKVLEKAGKPFDSRKKYFINQVSNPVTNQYVSFDEAVRVKILNPATFDYTDTTARNTYPISIAVQKGLVVVTECNLSPKSDRTNEIISSTPRTLPRRSQDSLRNNDLNKNGLLNGNENKRLNINEMANFINDAFQDVDAQVAKLDDKKSIDKYGGDLNFIRFLIYYVAKEKRYISFEEVIDKNMYDFESGKILDMGTDKEITLIDALKKRLIKLNNPEYMFDRTNIYLIESVLTDDGKRVPLTEAENVEKIINREACTYRYKRSTYFMQAAIKEGFVHGRIIDMTALKDLLVEFMNRLNEISEVQRKKRMYEKMSKIKVLEPLNREMHEGIKTRSYKVKEIEEVDEIIKPAYAEEVKGKPFSPVVARSEAVDVQIVRLNHSEVITQSKDSMPKNTFEDLYIIDPDSLNFISIQEALRKGLINVRTGEIKDSNSLKFVSIKQIITKGNIRIDAESEQPYFHQSSVLVHNRSYYIIDSIFDPKTSEKFSLNDANRLGLFSNGIFKHPQNGRTYQIDEAIEQGYVIGKKIYLSTIENDFIEYIRSPPKKPDRHQFRNDTPSLRSKSQSSVYLDDETTMFGDDEEALKKIKMNTVSIGKIGGVKDLRTGKYYKPADAEKLNLINIPQGWYRNSNTMEYLQIADAIDQKYIILETVKSVEENDESDSPKLKKSTNKNVLTKSSSRIALDSPEITKKTNTKPLSRSVSKTSIKSFDETFENKNQSKYIITSVIDPLRKIELNIDEAIKDGLFDINSGMYVDPISKKKLTMVDAIDQGLIKITHNTQMSYKVELERKNSTSMQNKTKTFSIRFVIDTQKQVIVPINEAIDDGIVDMDEGVLIDTRRKEKITLKDAYDEGLALTIADINNSSSTRCNFKIETVRNIKTGKEMTMKRALTKNWINLERRIYYNKYLKQEIPMSQALDMNLVILKVFNNV